MQTVFFTVANVAFTMMIGTLLALLLLRVSRFVQVLLTAVLVLVWSMPVVVAVFFFQAEDGIRDLYVTGVHTCALPIFRRAFEVAALRGFPGRAGAGAADARG